MRVAALAGATTLGAAVIVAASADTPDRRSAPTPPARATAPAAEPRPEGRAERRAGSSRTAEQRARPESRRPPIDWRQSIALGGPESGRLVKGVALPARGRHWSSWDPITRRSPSREWRRWGTDDLVRTTLAVAREFARDHRGAPRLLIGDLSRPKGGDFGPQFGYIGHASHQNGLDVDVYYPREDRRIEPPDSPDQVDVRLAQDLVDRFVAAGAERIFVGPSLPLGGPPDVVAPLVNHDNHLHIRIADA